MKIKATSLANESGSLHGCQELELIAFTDEEMAVLTRLATVMVNGGTIKATTLDGKYVTWQPKAGGFKPRE